MSACVSCDSRVEGAPGSLLCQALRPHPPHIRCCALGCEAAGGEGGSPRAGGAHVDLNRLDALLLEGGDLPSEDEEDEDYE